MINKVMKINEVLQPSDKALFEAIDANNDTGLLTEDVVRIIKCKNGTWSQPISGDEFNKHLREMAENNGITLS